VELCRAQSREAVASGGDVPPHAPDRGLCDRGPEREDVLAAVGEDPRRLPRLPELLGLLEGLRASLFLPAPPAGRQGQRGSRAHGAVLLVRFGSG